MFKFENVGEKIKRYAKISFWVSVVAEIISGIVLIVLVADWGIWDTEALAIIIPSMIAAPFVLWLSHLVLYGFGELVDKTCDIASVLCGDERKRLPYLKAEPVKAGIKKVEMIKQIEITEEMIEQITEIEKMRAQGVISEEEYQKKMRKIRNNR